MHTHTMTTSLLVWGGAPGTTSDTADFDRDAPVYALASAAGDDGDAEHIDRC